ncbi:MAG: ATP-binding protein [Candidatus Moranbacteria bacterium]|nr:ATP-binding protein [Candidatus Moranbacteria bacterium]
MVRLKQTSAAHISYLATAFVLIIALMTGVALLGLERVSTLNEKAELLRQKEIKTDQVQRMRNAVRERFIRLSLIVISDDSFLQDVYIQEFDLLASRFMVARNTIENMKSLPGEAALFSELRNLTAKGAPILASVVETALGGDSARAKKILLEESVPIQEQVMAQTDRILTFFEQANASAVLEMEQELQQTQRLMTAMAIAQVVLVLLIAMIVIRHSHKQNTGMQLEITRRRQSEMRLREAQDGLELQVQARTAELNRFKSTLDRTLDCVFMFDAATLLFFYFNEGALLQVGYTSDELLAMHPYDIKPNIGEAQFNEIIAPLLTGEQASLTFETVHQNKSGQCLPVEVFLQYIAPEDEPARFVAIVRDISERKRMERMKSEFVSTVSHELRTPLTVIKGNVDLMRRIKEADEESLSSIDQEAGRLTRLVGGLLMLAQAESGKLPLNFGRVELDLLLTEVFTEMRVLAGSKVRVHLNDIDQVIVNGDRDRLKQVLLNLVANAIQYTPAGGDVFLSLSRLGDQGRLIIRDTGPGIPAEDLPHIFDRFYRAEKSRTRSQTSGFGLGLSIAHWIIEHHGGQIKVESKEEKGTTFVIWLNVIK